MLILTYNIHFKFLALLTLFVINTSSLPDEAAYLSQSHACSEHNSKLILYYNVNDTQEFLQLISKIGKGVEKKWTTKCQLTHKKYA